MHPLTRQASGCSGRRVCSMPSPVSSTEHYEPGSRADIRRAIRHRRRSLTPAGRAALASNLARRIAGAPVFQFSRRVAAYLPNDGEMDLRPLIRRAWKLGKHCYLPVLNRRRLWFLPYHPDTPLANNRFGIPEPALSPRRRWPMRTLDLVLAPLVAFDDKGNRLGMGGGFYDRTFAYLASRSHWRRPVILGVAYGFQQVTELPSHPWDVPLHGVATEHGLRWFATR